MVKVWKVIQVLTWIKTWLGSLVIRVQKTLLVIQNIFVSKLFFASEKYFWQNTHILTLSTLRVCLLKTNAFHPRVLWVRTSCIYPDKLNNGFLLPRFHISLPVHMKNEVSASPPGLFSLRAFSFGPLAFKLPSLHCSWLSSWWMIRKKILF